MILSMRDELYNKNRLARAYIDLLDIVDADGVDTPIQKNVAIAGASTHLLRALEIEASIQKKKVRTTGQESPLWGLGDFIELISDNIFRVFNNKYQVTVECVHCKHVIKAHDDKCTHIDMHEMRNATTKREFVRLILEYESDLTDHTCEQCKTRSNTILHGKTHKLLMLREIITLVYDANKTAPKWFPQTLEFLSTNDQMLRYELVSIIEHSGSWNVNTGGSGHYFARIKCRNGRWYEFNDMSVTPSNSSPSQNSQILMYHLMEHSPLTDTERQSINAARAQAQQQTQPQQTQQTQQTQPQQTQPQQTQPQPQQTQPQQ